jgi:hypothetical protein
VFLALVSDDFTANFNAPTTDVDLRAGNELFNLALTLATEAAAQLIIALSHCPAPSMPRIEMASSTET